MSLSRNAERLQAWFDIYKISADEYNTYLNAHPKVQKHGAFVQALRELLSGEGTLYGLTTKDDVEDGSLLNKSSFYQIDKVTGETTLKMHLTPETSISAIAKNPNNNLVYRLTLNGGNIVYQSIDLTNSSVTTISTSGDEITGNPIAMTWYNNKFVFETDTQELATITTSGVLDVIPEELPPIYAGFRYITLSGGIFGPEVVSTMFGALSAPPLYCIINPNNLQPDNVLGPGAITEGSIQGLIGSLKMNTLSHLAITNDGYYAYVIGEVADETENTALGLINLYTPEGYARAITKIPSSIQQLVIV